MTSQMKFADLRGILQYVPHFRGAVFVMAVDGEVVASEHFSNLLLDLAVLHSLSVRVVLVHGASYQVRALGKKTDVVVTSSDGLGVTDAATLELSEEAINNLTGHILQQMTGVGLRAATGTWIEAHPAGIIRGRDLGFTGAIETIDVRGLTAVLNDDMLPVVPPLGYDGQGGVLRINSDAVALAVAIAMKAQKILYITAAGLKNPDGSRLPALSVDEAKKMAAARSPERDPATISSLTNAARACESGVARVHIIGGLQGEVLLEELFSNEGVGTMIYADEYQEIRPAKLSDIPAMMGMIRQSVADEELVPRTRKDMRAALGDYFVLETDGNPVGVLAVHLYPEHHLAELACLFIRASHENAGHGRKLVAFAELRAKERGASRLVALSTQAWRYFEQKCGFKEATDEILPPPRRQKLKASGRNSKIMVKAL
jgi:amino-acid N-acetyltransferase